MSEMAPVWKFGEVNPQTPEFKSLATGESVSFMPLETIWPGAKADYSRSIPWSPKASYTQFRKGDVLIPKITPTFEAGRTLIADIPSSVGLASTEVHVVRPLPTADPRFLQYCFQSSRFLDEGAHSLQGVGNLRRITPLFVQEHKVYDADLQTQRRIADYLDRETGEIDSMVDKLDELEDTLQVRKVEFIRRKTQLSTNDEPWETVPTAHLFETIGSGTTPKGDAHYTKSGEGVPWVTTSELRENVVQSTSQNVTEKAVASISSLKVHPKGAVVIAMYGATIGRLGILGVDAAMNQACCAFSSPRDVDSKFFYYTLWGQRDDIIRLAVGGGQPNISQNMLRRWKVPVPPLEEQRRIADYLDDVTTKIDVMLAKVAELKDLLTERRAALITDVLTGRKDVA